MRCVLSSKWKWQDLIVCSYHTPGPYEQESLRLRASLQALGVPYHAVCYRNLGELKWRDAVRLKPWTIAHFLLLYPNRPVLFVDADAIFLSDPREVLPNTWEGGVIPSVSVHAFGGRACSGTVICAPTTTARDVINAWCEIDLSRPALKQPQAVLDDMPEVNKELDARWCWIFDLSPKRYGPRVQPIIQHLQASREYRNEEGITPPPELVKNRQQFLAQERLPWMHSNNHK